MKIEAISVNPDCITNPSERNICKFSETFTSLGLKVIRHTVVPAEPSRIIASLDDSMQRTDIIFVRGPGLHRSKDFNKALANFLGKRLNSNNKFRSLVKEKYPFISGKALDISSKLPAGAKIIGKNVEGSPLFYLNYEGTIIVVSLAEQIQETEPYREAITTVLSSEGISLQKNIRIYKAAGIEPINFVEGVKSLVDNGLSLSFNYHLSGIQTCIRLNDGNEKEIRDFENLLYSNYGDYIYSNSTEDLEEKVLSELIDKGLTISTAESCTGGLISKSIVDIPGASNTYTGSMITYSDKTKIENLGVDSYLLKEEGAVSGDVAIQMSRRIRQELGTEIGISTTGIAGPTGGTADKPVGLVYIGLSSSEEEYCRKFCFDGDRSLIRTKASFMALFILWVKLEKNLLNFSFKDNSELFINKKI